ncbi:MAG: VapE domain-containing protein [Saprospiraceae bacterium]
MTAKPSKRNFTNNTGKDNGLLPENQAETKKVVVIPAGADANEPTRQEQADSEQSEGKLDPRLKNLEDKLRKKWTFRYNSVTCSTEIQNGKKWTRLDDFTLHSIVRELRKEGVALASKTRVAELLESDFCKKVNPIEQYFENLPKPGNRDYILDLAKTVMPTDDYTIETFYKFFKKWLVGAVANVFIKDRCANQVCFILSGKQGAFKSTWIRNLCPPALEPYYIEGGLDPDDKDSIAATTSNFIFNLDDYFAGITSRKINEFKGLLTKNTVKIRRPYARYSEEMPKICSFIASSNEQTFLHDPTGNRRFLPFEVQAIDIEAAKKIDINSVWAKAYQEYKAGFEYWLTKDDQTELERHNTRFEVQSSEYELLVQCFRKPETGEKGIMLTTQNVIDRIKENLGTSMTFSQKKIGEALRKAGFERKSCRVGGKAPVYAWEVMTVEMPDIEGEK